MADKNTGRDQPTSFAGSAGEVAGLADALAAVCKEAAVAQQSSELAQFQVADIEAEFSVVTTREGGSGVKLWVMGTEDAAAANLASHRVRFKLRRDIVGGPGLTITGGEGGDSLGSWDEGGRPHKP
jgi:hypothetical protein